MGYNLSSIRIELKKILEKKFFHNVFILSSGVAIAQIIVLAVSLLLARLYSADDFGYYQYYQSLLAFLIVISALRYDFAILVADKEKEVFNLGTLSTIIICCFTIILTIATTIIYLFKISIPNMPSVIYKYLWLLPISFFFASICQVLGQILIRFSNFKLISKTKIYQACGLSFFQLSIALFQKGPFGLFLGDAIGKFFGISSIIKWLKHKYSSSQFYISKTQIKYVSKKYRNYAIYSTPGTLLNIISLYLPNFFWGGIFGYNILGYYSLADKIFLIPFLLIGQSIAQVYVARLRELLTNNPSTLRHFFEKIVFRTALFLLIPMIVFSIFSPTLFSFVFGEKWRIAGEIASILVISQFFGFLSGITTHTLIILQKQKIQLIWEVLRIICVLIIFIMIKILLIPLMHAILWYSILMAFFYLLHLVISYHFIYLASLKTIGN